VIRCGRGQGGARSTASIFCSTAYRESPPPVRGRPGAGVEKVHRHWKPRGPAIWMAHARGVDLPGRRTPGACRSFRIRRHPDQNETDGQRPELPKDQMHRAIRWSSPRAPLPEPQDVARCAVALCHFPDRFDNRRGLVWA